MRLVWPSVVERWHSRRGRWWLRDRPRSTMRRDATEAPLPGPAPRNPDAPPGHVRDDAREKREQGEGKQEKHGIRKIYFPILISRRRDGLGLCPALSARRAASSAQAARGDSNGGLYYYW